MAFRWRADDSPILVHFGSTLLSSTKKKNKKRRQSLTPSGKTFWIRACIAVVVEVVVQVVPLTVVSMLLVTPLVLVAVVVLSDDAIFPFDLVTLVHFGLGNLCTFSCILMD